MLCFIIWLVMLLGKLHLVFLSFRRYHMWFTDVLTFFNNSLLFAVAISVGQKRLETELIINSFYPDKTSIQYSLCNYFNHVVCASVILSIIVTLP